MVKESRRRSVNMLNNVRDCLKSNIVWIITGIIASVLMFIMFYMSPLRADDLVWGSEVGIDRLKNWFEGYNGRYTGNLFVLIMTRIPIVLRVVFQILIMILFIKFIYDIMAKNSNAIGLFLILFVLMPLSVFTQTITWISGFANYITSAVLIFFHMKMVYGILLDNRKYQFWMIVLLGLICFIGQFILETATIYLVVFYLSANILYIIQSKKISICLFVNFILTVTGAFCMFMNSAYSAALKGETTTTYKEITITDNILSLIGEWWLKFVDNIVPKWIAMNHLINIILMVLLLLMWSVCVGKKFAKLKIFMQITGSLLLGFFLYDTIDKQWEILYSVGNGIWAVISIIFLLYIIVTITMVVSDKNKKIRMLTAALSQVFLMGPLVIVNPINDRCFLITYIFWGILTAEFFAYIVFYLAEYIQKEDLLLSVRKFFRRSLSAFLLVMLVQMLLGQSFSYKIEKICKEQIQLCIEQKWDKLVLPYVPYSIEYCYGYNILNDDEYWIENYKHFYNIPKDVELSFMDYNMWILRSVSD